MIQDDALIFFLISFNKKSDESEKFGSEIRSIG